jgi:hypothetical protein
MLAGSEVALFHGALVSKALGPFQEQFHAFATAKAAYCTFISCHFAYSPLLRVTIGLQEAFPFVPIRLTICDLRVVIFRPSCFNHKSPITNQKSLLLKPGAVLAAGIRCAESV